MMPFSSIKNPFNRQRQFNGGGGLAAAMQEYQRRKPNMGPRSPRFGMETDTGQMPGDRGAMMQQQGNFLAKPAFDMGQPKQPTLGSGAGGMQQLGGMSQIGGDFSGYTGGMMAEQPQGQPADFNPRQAFASVGGDTGGIRPADPIRPSLGLGSLGPRLQKPGMNPGYQTPTISPTSQF